MLHNPKSFECGLFWVTLLRIDKILQDSREPLYSDHVSRFFNSWIEVRVVNFKVASLFLSVKPQYCVR